MITILGVRSERSIALMLLFFGFVVYTRSTAKIITATGKFIFKTTIAFVIKYRTCQNRCLMCLILDVRSVRSTGRQAGRRQNYGRGWKAAVRV
mgnify:CR=1 FL=1